MKRVFTIIAAVIISANVFLPQQVNAQSPEKMSYQAVIRDSNSNLIKSTVIGMKISILQGSASGTPVYSETQTPTTNANGLVSIQIGDGAGFSSIDWGNGLYFIKTETDITGGSSYTISGTSQLLSVPYALHAKSATSITGTLNETDPIFVAAAASGITGTNITNWSAAYGWGNHASAGYLTSFTETDPKIGTNTLGYSPKWDGTSLVTGALFQDDSGNVGIGTITPINKLSVDGNANFSTSILTPLIQPLSGDGTALTIQTNNAASVSGGLTIKTGNIASNGGSTGNIFLSAGKELWTGQGFGASLLLSGYPGGNGGGSTTLSGGNSWADGGGDVTLQGGNKGWGIGGSIYLNGGNGGGGAGGAGNIIMNTGNDTNAGPGIISMKINGTEIIRVNSNSNVGIGTTTPATALDVNGIITATDGNSTNWNAAYGWGNHATAGYLTSFSETDPIFVASAANGITGTNITNWSAAYGWGNHASAGYLTSFSETDPKIGTNTLGYSPKWDGTSLVAGAIFQDASGNVGIGTTTPGFYKLDVQSGIVRINSGGFTYPLVIGEGGAFGNVRLGATNEAQPDMVFGNNNSIELMRITNAGNVGIGTTMPSSKLTVNGTITATTFVKSSGTASQFLKADGSVDSNTYLTAINEVADEFTATTSQTDFNLAQTPSANSKVKMYINGIRISKTAYSNTGTTLTYIPANNGSYTLTSGDRIQFDYYY